MRRATAISAVLIAAALGVAPARAAPPAEPLALGVNTTGMTEDTGAALDRFAAQAGRRPSIAMFYRDWYEGWSTALVEPRFLAPALARGAVPMITWLPQLATGDPVSQPAYAPARIAAGDFDPFLRRAAREAAAFGRPLLLRLGHEMNGSWYPWGARVDGNSAADYVAMWRHVVSVFREEGADEVRWVWSPNVYGPGASEFGSAVLPFQSFYPGDRWVDVVGLDGYNWGSVRDSGWQSFAAVFGPSYEALARLTDKPMMICETASSEVGGDKAGWIRAIPAVLRSRMPRVRALVWFDRDKETDWEVSSSGPAAAAFRALARSPLFSGGAREILEAPPAARAARR